jgi:hypothetical protein
MTSLIILDNQGFIVKVLFPPTKLKNTAPAKVGSGGFDTSIPRPDTTVVIVPEILALDSVGVNITSAVVAPAGIVNVNTALAANPCILLVV